MPETHAEGAQVRDAGDSSSGLPPHAEAVLHDELERSRVLFETFYRQNYSPALRYVRSRTSDADAEAMVGDAFVVAWHHHRTGGALDRAWLFTVVRNKVGDHYRRAKRPPAPLPVSAQVADGSAASDLKLDVHRALRGLKAQHAEALVLAYWADLPTKEAAEVLGISHVAFRVRLTRAKRAFVRALGVTHQGRG